MPRVTARHPTDRAGGDPEPRLPTGYRPGSPADGDSAHRPSYRTRSSTRQGAARLRATMRAETLRRRTRPIGAIALRYTPVHVPHPEKDEPGQPMAQDRADRAAGADI